MAIQRCPSTASAQLTLRCVLALLVAMTAALGVGLLAWGPIGPGPHDFTDTRQFAGIDNALDTLVSLLPALASIGGLTALRRASWPRDMAGPWRLFFMAIAGASVCSTAYHVRPGDGAFILVQVSMAVAFGGLLAGFLAERVHPRFGSRGACVLALLLPIGAALYAACASVWFGIADVRGLLLMQLVPVLLVPAGALGLPGRGATSPVDWMGMLMLYLMAKGCEVADAALFATTGWISGHSLMHMLLALSVAWVAYRAFATAPSALNEPPADVSSQRIASANTLAS